MGQDIFRILSLFIINLTVSSKYSDQQPHPKIISIYYCVYSLNRKITDMPQIVCAKTITLQYSGGVLEGVIRDISDITANASAYAVSITMLRNDSTPYRQVSQLTYEIRSGNLLVIHAWGSFVAGHMLSVSVIVTKANL